ncbi:hypothetical protein M3P05_09875 [Sansalvadorimonas sp. 2012CJ34-2]|uniref:Uncharacterized protein n=1 Tax=Parendozoicomonas callyspongiae TaxID=2942213 RepID=A0ABT0PFW6_9GAMM|nr:hypothetical protein [Sansalvadorimonas sp. 2012CJ34-2]MCL6270233.1 hypothetical protein [Sansalvadorimonas sp. 2012CJ34-2]
MESGMNTTCSASLPSGVTAAISPGASGGQGDAGVSSIVAQNPTSSVFLPQSPSRYADLVTKCEIQQREIAVLKFYNDTYWDTFRSMNQKIDYISCEYDKIVQILNVKDVEIDRLKKQHGLEVQQLRDEHVGEKWRLESTLQREYGEKGKQFRKKCEENEERLEKEYEEKKQQLKQNFETSMERFKRVYELKEQGLSKEYEEKERQLKSANAEDQRWKEYYKNENMSLRQSALNLSYGTMVAISAIKLIERISVHRNHSPSIPCHVQDFKILDQSYPITVWPDDQPNMGVELYKENQHHQYKQAVLEGEISSLKSQLEDLKSMAGPEAGGKQSSLSSLLGPEAGGIPGRKRKVAKQMPGSDETTLPASKKVAIVVIDKPDDAPLIVTRFGRRISRPKGYSK